MPVIVSRPHRSLRARAALVLAAVLALGAFLAAAAQAAPGDLDPTFGSGGSVRLFPSNEDISLNAVAVQPDGMVVLTGSDQTTNSWITVRLLANGTLDPNFSVGGIARLAFPAGSFGQGRAVAIQPDGKIVVAGVAKGNVDGDIAVLRYLPDGNPDLSFGGGDGVEIFQAPGTEERAEAVAIGTGGRILATGETRSTDPKVTGVSAFALVLRPDGEPDASFNATGFKAIQTTGAEKADQGSGIAETPDGKIVVADETGNGAGNGFTIVRLTSAGALDPEFGAGTGIVNVPIPGAGTAKGRSTAVVVQPDGSIVAAGYGYDLGGPKGETLDSKFVAIRLLGDGKLDTSFGGAGTGIMGRQVGEGEDSARTVALSAAGRIFLAGGYEPSANDQSVAAMRLDPSGVPDPTFGVEGIARRGPQAAFGDTFEGAALDSRERVVIVSKDFIGGGNTEVEVSRFLGDIPPDPPASPASGSGGAGAPAKAQQPPHARLKAPPRKLEAAKLTRFSGTAVAPAGVTIGKVQIAVVRSVPRKGGRASTTCLDLANARGRFKSVKAKQGECPLRWLKAKGTAKWSFSLKTVLPAGRYVVYARAVSTTGLAESTFSRGAGNRYGFRLEP